MYAPKVASIARSASCVGGALVWRQVQVRMIVSPLAVVGVKEHDLVNDGAHEPAIELTIEVAAPRRTAERLERVRRAKRQ